MPFRLAYIIFKTKFYNLLCLIIFQSLKDKITFECLSMLSSMRLPLNVYQFCPVRHHLLILFSSLESLCQKEYDLHLQTYIFKECQQHDQHIALNYDQFKLIRFYKYMAHHNQMTQNDIIFILQLVLKKLFFFSATLNL